MSSDTKTDELYRRVTSYETTKLNKLTPKNTLPKPKIATISHGYFYSLFLNFSATSSEVQNFLFITKLKLRFAKLKPEGGLKLRLAPKLNPVGVCSLHSRHTLSQLRLMHLCATQTIRTLKYISQFIPSILAQFSTIIRVRWLTYHIFTSLKLNNIFKLFNVS